MAVIKTKVPYFNGIRATVLFTDGVGETDNPELIKWFKNHGYVVETQEKTEKPEKTEKEEVEEVEYKTPDPIDEFDTLDSFKPYEAVKLSEMSLDDMTPVQLREYGKSLGLGKEIKNVRDKTKLISIIKG